MTLRDLLLNSASWALGCAFPCVALATSLSIRMFCRYWNCAVNREKRRRNRSRIREATDDVLGGTGLVHDAAGWMVPRPGIAIPRSSRDSLVEPHRNCAVVLRLVEGWRDRGSGQFTVEPGGDLPYSGALASPHVLQRAGAGAISGESRRGNISSELPRLEPAYGAVPEVDPNQPAAIGCTPLVRRPVPKASRTYGPSKLPTFHSHTGSRCGYGCRESGSSPHRPSDIAGHHVYGTGEGNIA